MRIPTAAILATLLLGACGDQKSTEERKIEDQADIAAVEALQEPPALPLALQPIRYPDIEKNKLYGASCAFVPDGGGLGALAIAMVEAAYLKVDGTIVRLAPDAGSAEHPLGTRQQYDGKTYSLAFSLESEGKQSGYETTDFKGRLVVRDSTDRVVFDKPGLVQCGV